MTDRQIISQLVYASLFLFCGCYQSMKEEQTYITKAQTKIETIQEFKWKGHDYIEFWGSHGGRSSTIIHDPDCSKCKEDRSKP